MNGSDDDPWKDYRCSWLNGLTVETKKVVGGYVIDITVNKKPIPVSKAKIKQKVTEKVLVEVTMKPADEKHFELDLKKLIEIVENVFPNSGLNCDFIGHEWSQPEKEIDTPVVLKYVSRQLVNFVLDDVNPTIVHDFEALDTSIYPRTYKDGILKGSGFYPGYPWVSEPKLVFEIKDKTSLPVVDNTQLLETADQLLKAFKKEIRK
jgi:hypothetical protein